MPTIKPKRIEPKLARRSFGPLLQRYCHIYREGKPAITTLCFPILPRDIGVMIMDEVGKSCVLHPAGTAQPAISTGKAQIMHRVVGMGGFRLLGILRLP